MSVEASIATAEESSGDPTLAVLLADGDVQAEIIHINTRARPIALQIAPAIPLIAGLLGLLNGFRMTRLADPKPSGAGESLLVG
jgi:hypothetical protein